MTVRGLARRLLGALGMAVFARGLQARWRAREWREANAPRRRAGAPDGLSIPPDFLMYLVAGTGDAGWFLESGPRAAESIRSALAEVGVDLGAVGSLLDFGCGCGRVVRHWARLPVAVHGCDLNPRLVGWCRDHLPFGTFAVNRLQPPLGCADGSFGLVYALSVFTHMGEPDQRAWMAELHRVLRPGGTC